MAIIGLLLFISSAQSLDRIMEFIFWSEIYGPQAKNCMSFQFSPISFIWFFFMHNFSYFNSATVFQYMPVACLALIVFYANCPLL